MHSRTLAVTAALVAVLLALSTVGPAGRASASRVDDLRAQARQIASQIESNGERIAALGEEYDGAVYRLDQIHSQQQRAARQLESAQRAATALRQQKATMAAKLYTGRSNVTAADSASSVMGTATSEMYSEAVSARSNAILDRYVKAQGDLRVKQRALATLEVAGQRERDRLATARRELESADTRARQLLTRVKGELGSLIEQEQQRREAALAAAARARAAADAVQTRAVQRGVATEPSQSPSTPLPDVPAPSAGVAAVIAYARAQIGKPYVWGATGPNSFDCSGLTMRAWEQAGVYMPHYSGAQFSMFPKVPISQLQPGDLVFKGPGGSAHVALYVGGGMQIAATHTGSTVKLQPVDYPHLSGAVRP